MVELPGDGKDNSGSGFDLPIDEVSGVFVDSEAGTDSSTCGTRAAPCQTLGAALSAATSQTFFYLAARATPYSGTQATTITLVGMVGGLDPVSWTRTGATSRFDDELCAGPGFVLDSIARSAPLLEAAGCRFEIFPTVVGVHSSFGAIFDGGSLYIDTDIGSLQLLGAATTAVIGGSVGTIVVGDTNNAAAEHLSLEHVAVTGAVDVDASDSLSAVNTRFAAPLFIDSLGGSISLFHCTVVTNGATPIAASVQTSAGDITVIDSVLARADAGSLVDSKTSAFTALIIGSDLSSAGDDAIVVTDGSGALTSGGIADIGTATLPGVTGHDNLAVSPGLDAFRLQASSPLVGAAVNAEALLAPPSVAADFDGQCRYADGAPDIGADEVQ